MPIESLVLHKLADRSQGERVTRYRADTGEAYLADPATWREDDPSTHVAKPWPLAGIELLEAPKEAHLPIAFVTDGIAEGWISLDNPSMIHRPGGPPEEPWRLTHTFTHADAIVISTTEGAVRYRVLESPDKWPAEKVKDPDYADGIGFGGEVRSYYHVKRES